MMSRLNMTRVLMYLTVVFSAVLILPGALYAEYIFLTNGSIIEGSILKEDDKKVEIKIESGENQEISRKNILRILYHEKFRERKFINKTNHASVEAYIVDEDAESYTYRTELLSTKEIKIPKGEVESISKNKPGIGGAGIELPVYSPSGYYMRGFVPGWGQYYTGHYIKSSIFGISFAGSAAWMVYANLKYRKSRDKYNNLSSDHSEKEFNDAYTDARNDGKIAMWSVITTSVIYALNWCDIIIFSTPEPGTFAGMAKYGDAYVNLNIGSDYLNSEYNNYTNGFKAEMEVSVKF